MFLIYFFNMAFLSAKLFIGSDLLLFCQLGRDNQPKLLLNGLARARTSFRYVTQFSGLLFIPTF
jgi:hypothetical protein